MKSSLIQILLTCTNFSEDYQLLGICHGLINYEYCLAFEDIYKENIYVDKSKFHLLEK